MTAAVAAACFGFVASAVDSAFAQDARKNTGIISGDCRTTAQKFLIATKPLTVSSNSESVLPESIAFVQGAAGCVIVSFSAEARASIGGNLQLRPTLDGMPTSVPQIANLVGAGAMSGSSAYGMNFVFANVPRGRHVLRFEYSALPIVYLQTRSTVVNYVK
jgi:hypothetical protein